MDKHPFSSFGNTPEWAEAYVAGTNWRESIRAIEGLELCPVVNDRASTHRLQSKLFQLRAAASADFCCPLSLVSNDLQEIVDFSRQHNSLIVKALGDPHVPVIADGVPQKVVTTSTLDQDLLASQDLNTASPSLVHTRAGGEKV